MAAAQDWRAFAVAAAESIGYQILRSEGGAPESGCPARVWRGGWACPRSTLLKYGAVLTAEFPGLFEMAPSAGGGGQLVSRPFWWRKADAVLICTSVDWWKRGVSVEEVDTAAYWVDTNKDGRLPAPAVWQSGRASTNWQAIVTPGLPQGALEVELSRTVDRVLCNGDPGLPYDAVPVRDYDVGVTAEVFNGLLIMRSRGPMKLAPSYRPPSHGVAGDYVTEAVEGFCWQCAVRALEELGEGSPVLELKMTGSHAPLWDLKMGRTRMGVTKDAGRPGIRAWASSSRFFPAFLRGGDCRGRCGFPDLYSGDGLASWSSEPVRRKWLLALSRMQVNVWTRLNGAEPAAQVAERFLTNTAAVAYYPVLTGVSGGPAVTSTDDSDLRASFRALWGSSLAEAMQAPRVAAQLQVVLSADRPEEAFMTLLSRVWPSPDVIPSPVPDALCTRINELAQAIHVASLDVYLTDSTLRDIGDVVFGDVRRTRLPDDAELFLWWALVAEGTTVRLAVGMCWPGGVLLGRMPQVLSWLAQESPGGGAAGGHDGGMRSARLGG